MNNWYAVYVKTGDEENVKARLDYVFCEEVSVHVPQRELYERKDGKLSRKIKTLFPGYLFLNGFLSDKHVYKMNNVPNLYRILKDGQRPTPIPTHEIELFRHLMVDDVIGISTLLAEEDEIIVLDGPLLSLKGRILRVDQRKGRVKVALEFLGQIKNVDLGINVVHKI